MREQKCRSEPIDLEDKESVEVEIYFLFVFHSLPKFIKLRIDEEKKKKRNPLVIPTTQGVWAPGSLACRLSPHQKKEGRKERKRKKEKKKKKVEREPPSTV